MKKNYKYADQAKTVVSWQDKQGFHSCLAEALPDNEDGTPFDLSIVAPLYTDEELAAIANEAVKAEALAYLDSTDFYFTIDKYTTLDDAKKSELEAKRAEARAILNA